ncbi:hypothetical protein AMTR_s00940p00008730, partial [Amborella trichopoda]
VEGPNPHKLKKPLLHKQGLEKHWAVPSRPAGAGGCLECPAPKRATQNLRCPEV